MNTAEQIYNHIYGNIDDKRFKAAKLAEIEDWLAEGDEDDATLNDLVAEWSEYDAADIAARS